MATRSWNEVPPTWAAVIGLSMALLVAGCGDGGPGPAAQASTATPTSSPSLSDPPASTTPASTTDAPDSCSWQIRQGEPGWISGTVLTPTGDPIAGVDVTVMVKDFNAHAYQGGGPKPPPVPGEYIEPARTDATGTFKVARQPGCYELTLGSIHDSCMKTCSPRDQLRVEAWVTSGHTTRQNLKVPTEGVLRGKVVDKSGSPWVGDVMVKGRTCDVSVRTDDQGLFTIGDLAANSYDLWAMSPNDPGELVRPVVLTAGGTVAELTVVAP